ncbi:hypothetical protein ACVGOW_10670 [Pseudonocardia saturnea]
MREQIEQGAGMRRGGGPTALREVRAVPRRRSGGTGPRPVRPGVVAVAARPVQPARPVGAGAPVRRGERVLLRTVPVLPARVLRRRRVAAAIGMALLTAAVVVALGLLADVAAAARQSGAGQDAGPSLTAVVPSPGQVDGAIGG